MLTTPITDGTGQPINAPGPAAPATGIDIGPGSTLGTFIAGAPYALEVEVTSLTAAAGVPIARIIVEDTVTAFAAAVQLAEFVFTGPIVRDASVKLSHLHYDRPGLRAGIASGRIRARVDSLSGTTPSLTFRASLGN